MAFYFKKSSAFPDQLLELQNTLDVSEGRSPTRARTMKEYDQEIADLRKENFSLKLDIYLLGEKLLSQYSADGNNQRSTKSIAELSLEVEALKSEVFRKHELLLKASETLETLEKKHRAEIQQKVDLTTRCHELELKIRQMEKFLNSEEKRAIRAEESDSKNTNAEWYKQAFSLVDMTSDCENLDPANEDVQKLSTGEMLSLVESQRATIQYLTEIEENHITTIERYKVNRIKLEKLIKGMSDVISRYRNEGKTDEIDEELKLFLRDQLFEETETRYQELLDEKSKEIEAVKAVLNDKQLQVENLERQLIETASECDVARKETLSLTDSINELKSELKSRDDSMEYFKKYLNKMLTSEYNSEVKTEFSSKNKADSSLLLDLKQLEDMFQRLASVNDSSAGDSQLMVQLKGLDLIQESQVKDGSMQLKKQVEDLQIRLQESVNKNNHLEAERNRKASDSHKIYEEVKNENEQLNRQLEATKTLNELLQQQLNLMSHRVNSENGKELNEGISRIVNEVEMLKMDVKRMQCGLKPSSGENNAAESTNNELVNLLKNSQAEVDRLRFLLDSTEDKVSTLGGKLQFYRRLLNEANIDVNRDEISYKSEHIFTGLCRSAPTTPLKNEPESPLSFYLRPLSYSEGILPSDLAKSNVPSSVSVECQTTGSVDNLLDQTADSEIDLNTTKEVFRTRLEELVRFLEKLLHFDGNSSLDVSDLTPGNLEKFQRCIEKGLSISRSLSRSLIAWENSTCLEDEHSSVFIDDVVTAKKRLSVSSRVSSANSPRRRLFKAKLMKSGNASELLSLTNCGGDLKPFNDENKSLSESDAWSEPDLNVSKQRIGLSQPETVLPINLNSSTESDTERLLEANFLPVANEVEFGQKSLSPLKLSPRSSSRYSRSRNSDATERRRLDECLSENSILKQQLQQSAKKYNGLLEEFEQWLAANSSSAEIYDKYKDTVQQLQAFIKQLKSELLNKDVIIIESERERSNLMTEMEELTEKFESYRETIESLQMMLNVQENISKEAARKTELLEYAISQKEATLEEALQSQEITTASLDKATQMLTHSEVCINNLQETKKVLESELERKNQSCELLVSEVKMVKQELNLRYESCQQKLEEHQKTSQKKINELQNLLVEKERDCAEMQHQLDESHSKLKSLDEHIEKSRCKFLQMKNERDEIESSSKSLQSLYESLEKSSKLTIERLTDEVNVLRSNCDEMEKLNSSLQSRCDELSKRNSPLRLTIGSLEECSSSINSPESTSSFMYMPLAVGSSSEEGNLPHVTNANSVQGLVYSSPDLGIESDQSRFSSLDRQKKSDNGKDVKIVENSVQNYLEPGFPVDNDWNVVNSAPPKTQRYPIAPFTISSSHHHKNALNQTHHGVLTRNVSETAQTQDETDSCCASDVNTNFSSKKLKLLKQGNNESVKILREIRRRVRNRLVDLKKANDGATRNEYETWRQVYSCTDDLKECLTANDQLIIHIIKSFNTPFATSEEVHQAITEEEWKALQLDLAKQRQRAEEAEKHMEKMSGNMKKKWVKAISKQLTLTAGVLQQAGNNMEKNVKKVHSQH
ncbi:hypothetical protein CHUAL_008146 [Chamberlinius hualienensis]